MKKIAFLFPGQGSQTVGMGKDFFNKFDIAKKIFHQADELVGFSLSDIIFEGPIEELTKTENAQLAIYVTSYAISEVLLSLYPHFRPYVCAGLSLGEYSALTAAGYLEFSEGLELVKRRARFMNEACEANRGAMAAVLGLEAEKIQKIVEVLVLGGEKIWIANYNTPGQIVISGEDASVRKASSLLKEEGAKRVIPLQVHGAFHSGLMTEAQKKLEPLIHLCPLSSSSIRIAMNVVGDYVDSVDEIKKYMIAQVTHSVCWQQSIERMKQSGIDLFLEIGVGKTLAGMNKKMGLASATVALEKIEDLQQLQ